MFKSLGHKVFILNILILLFFGSMSLANTEEKPAEEGHGEAKQEKKADLPPWTEIQNKISQLEAKMEQKRSNINRLIEEKQHVKPDSLRVKEIINLMISEHKELQSLAKEHEKTITILKFRYPERGAKEDRKYEPTEVKSLEQMEQELGIDGRLTRNMKKLRKQYGEDEESKKKPKIQEQKKVEMKKEKSIEESGTIIIHK